MGKEEIIERLEEIAKHAVYVLGEEPFFMSLDDGIAIHEAIEILKSAQPERMNGKWEMKWHSLFKREVPTCSVCKAGYFFITNFCPKCGADMRKGGGQCENS